MKILFLDIDGVVNCKTTTERFGPFIGIDPKLAAKVQKIIKETQCSVVLSSTWRLEDDFRKEVRAKVCSFINVTANLKSNFRGDEIDLWLKDNNKRCTYAILDDNSDFHPHQNLFKTSWDTGITDEVVEQVIQHLGRTTPVQIKSNSRSYKITVRIV